MDWVKQPPVSRDDGGPNPAVAYTLSCSELPGLPEELRIANFTAELSTEDAVSGRWQMRMTIFLQEDGKPLVLSGSYLQMRGVRDDEDAIRRATRLISKFMLKLQRFAGFVHEEAQRS